MLTLLGDKIVPSGIKGNLLALCPTMDLLAAATKEDHIYVFRVNGEVVFSVFKNRIDGKVIQLRWKPNGRLLAIGYDNGILLLVNTYTGSVVQKLQIAQIGESPIRYLAWGSSLTNVSSILNQVQTEDRKTTLESLLSQESKGFKHDLPPNLPVELAALDIETLLPKISPLPAMSRDEDLFSSRASLDSLFHGTKREDQESIDALLIGLDHGQMQLKVYDTFSLGQFSAPNTTMTIINHASHPITSTHALLWQAGSAGSSRIHLQALDIRPITDAGRYLSLIASKTTQLQNLLRYLNLAKQQILNEFKNSQDLPKKFMRNAEESLHEHDHCSLVDAMFHLAATGHCFNTMKEWLVEDLSERGQKRWEKAATTGYENVRQYTHENLLPGLQRFGVLMSRLQGLSKFQESSIALGIETQDLDQIFDTLTCLNLLGHCILIYANCELKEAVAFATWMKREIDIQATDPTSATADEHLETDVIPDYPKIVEYIRGAMLKSQLYELLDLDDGSGRSSWDPAKEGSVMYEDYRAHVKKVRDGEPCEKRLPGLSTLLSQLNAQCTEVFAKTSAAQGRKVRLGDTLLFGENLSHTDMIMIPETDLTASQQTSVYIAKVQNRRPSIVIITRMGLSIINGISSLIALSAASIRLPKGVQIRDIKFADTQDIVIVSSENAQSQLLFIRFKEASKSSEGLLYSSISEAHDGGADNDFSDSVAQEACRKHVFPSSQHPWEVGHVEVNGRQGRRTLCVVSADNSRYALFDLDSWQHTEERDDEEEEV